ncbi:hypothetical protein AGMMS49531_11490 [Endomicrobiia bacterium]|nr:hypothetical protein AGMMS49531_11490 [Endomicrobiia bacterium]GHT65509.1 hypothetical protein AGMMS49556_05470 [Endomicrobiia bacterium]
MLVIKRSIKAEEFSTTPVYVANKKIACQTGDFFILENPYFFFFFAATATSFLTIFFTTSFLDATFFVLHPQAIIGSF